MDLNYLDFHIHTPLNRIGVTEIENIYLQSVQKAEPKADYFTCGLHPWHLDVLTLKECQNLLFGIAQSPNLLAIGECGLDKNTDFPLELQLEFFRLHILIAKQFHKPLIIHCVRRHGELLQLLKSEKFKEPAVIHGFDSKLSLAEQLMDHGLMFSFGSAILKPEHPAAEVLANIPDDRFFLETDDYNEPIEAIYRKAADLRKTDVGAIVDLVYRNLDYLKS